MGHPVCPQIAYTIINICEQTGDGVRGTAALGPSTIQHKETDTQRSDNVTKQMHDYAQITDNILSWGEQNNDMYACLANTLRSPQLDVKYFDILEDYITFSIEYPFKKKYSQVLLTPESLGSFYERYKEYTFLSLGCGHATIETFLQKMGMFIINTDPYPPQTPYGFIDEAISADEAVKQFSHGIDGLMFIHSSSDSWPVNALKTAQQLGTLPRFIFYIGDGRNGVCADDAFYDFLEEHYIETCHYDCKNWRGSSVCRYSGYGLTFELKTEVIRASMKPHIVSIHDAPEENKERGIWHLALGKKARRARRKNSLTEGGENSHIKK